MNVLAFEPQAERAGGRRVRRARFESRSCLPLNAACLVANTMRETLAVMLANQVSLRLLRPLIPEPHGWAEICRDAHLFVVRGPRAEAAFVVRSRDALALAAAAFGETAEDARALSPVEGEVLARALRGLSGALAPVCGLDLSPCERTLDIAGYRTYFEVLVERPAQFRIGVALFRDPVPQAGATMRIEDLLEVEIEVGVEFACGSLPAAGLLDLGPGSNVPMKTKMGEPALLKAAGSVLARGECGALGERSVLLVKGI